MKAMNLLATPGGAAAPTTDFGEVTPGSSSAPVTTYLTNTGDTIITTLRLWVEQDSTADGVYAVTVNGTPVTGTSEATATELNVNLAPGEYVTVVEQWTIPPGDGVDIDTGTLVARYS